MDPTTDPTLARDPRELYTYDAREAQVLRAGTIMRSAVEICIDLMTSPGYPMLDPAIDMYMQVRGMHPRDRWIIQSACMSLLDIKEIREAVYGF